MRKALLVVALVAASFAGGAAVNGPGLQWAKGRIGARLRQADAIPTVEVNADPPKAPPEAKPGSLPPEEVPATPERSLDEGLSRALRAVPAASARTPAAPPPPPPSNAPDLLLAEPPAELKPPADPGSGVAEPPSPPASPSDQGGWGDAPGPAPSTAVVPEPKRSRGPTDDVAVSAASTAPPPSAPGPGDWSAIRKRMRAMGVTRYWVEGTPEGAVTVRCVVPVPGHEAVSRQFEAQAPDDLQAAEAVLRRAALGLAAERLKD